MLGKAQPWRLRAEEYRTFANASTDAAVRNGYLQLAKHCDSLAERQERMWRDLSHVPGREPSQSRDYG